MITDEEARASRLLERLNRPVSSRRISLLPYPLKRWQAEVGRSSLFLHHVLLEGVTLYDPECVLKEGLATLAAQKPNVEGEIQRQMRQLRLYRDLRRLNGQHFFALSHLYAIGKATAFARCVELGETTFVKEHALESLAICRPTLKAATQTIARLRPFYDRERGREAMPLPFSPAGAEGAVTKAIEAIEQLARE